MTDVLIIGGGLAGLSCARVLQHQGVSYTLMEASDALGGRVRTDEVDGFLLDRGFQVLLTAYPETERQLDYQRLGLRSFYDGALVFTGRGFQRVADPRRQPSAAWSTLRASVGSVADKLRILRLRQAVTRPPLQTLFERPETSTLDALRTRYGFSDTMIERFFRPFFGGIFLDQSLAASSRMFEFV
ncbi:MAG: FAD-dependent oxidoreductase, partial [Bacteroidota bacterium]